MNITELIAAIRVWQAENAEYEAACDEPIEIDGFKGYKTTPRRLAAIKALDATAMEVIHDAHNDDVLAHLVALADEVERLKATERAFVDAYANEDNVALDALYHELRGDK